MAEEGVPETSQQNKSVPEVQKKAATPKAAAPKSTPKASPKKPVSTAVKSSTPKISQSTTEVSAIPEGKLRSGLIFAVIGLAAAIIFGLLYMFVLAPTVPDGSIGWFLFSFATGLTMIVMPCTLPLAFVIVPLAMGKGMFRGLGMALAFGAGVTLTLSLYGVVIGLLGQTALDTFGGDADSIKNWVYAFAGIFALIFALSEIGLLNVHMPTYSGAAPAFIQKRQEVIKAFLLGMFLGNVGVGCPHPATPLILIEIATSGDVLYGWLLFLVHAIGRVLPLLLLAFLAILGVNGLNWLMSRKNVVERVTGWAMVFVAGFILTLGLFTHDWWVNSGIHGALEVLTQESRVTGIVNETLGTNVAHVHGLEEGEGLFGLPLHWGSWFLVLVWLIPIWMWYLRKRKSLEASPAFKLKKLEKEYDKLEKNRRQVEAIANIDELDPSFDLDATEAQLDALEKARRTSAKKARYGEEGLFKDPVARSYEVRMLGMHRNYLVAVSIMLALIFIYFMPKNFLLQSQVGDGHSDHEGATHTDHGGVDPMTFDTNGAHEMGGGVMNASGETLPGASIVGGEIILADGTTLSDMTGGGLMKLPGTVFSKATQNLPFATEPEFVYLEDGDAYSVNIEYVQKEVGNRTLRMMAYNRSVPGPFIKVAEGAEVTITVTNNTDIDQSLHSHGVRLNNLADGVPYLTQDPIKPGESYTHVITFDEPGTFWYHPHTRDDYGQEMGLYGNYIVEPTDPEYYSPVNQEMPLVIDDILIDNDQIADFYKEFTNFALLGRFGNEYLVNGVKDYTVNINKGDVVRFLMTNVSNARTYNLSIPGARIKLVGADLSKYEQEVYTDSVLISPSQRVIVEAYFPKAQTYKLMHTMPDGEVELARFVAQNTESSVSHLDSFNLLRTNEDLKKEFEVIKRDFRSAKNDKQLLLTIDLSNVAVDHSMHTHGSDAGSVPLIDHSQHAHAQEGGDLLSSIQWDDPGQSDVTNATPAILWKIQDKKTGRVNMDIDWRFRVGDMVKVSIENDANADHVMQHPIHFHGQRFVVLKENGSYVDNMAWKDTVLVYPGETTEILVDMSNQGEWMSHCHISEHLHAGMMMSFRVENASGTAAGDEYRAGLGSDLHGIPLDVRAPYGTEAKPIVSTTEGAVRAPSPVMRMFSETARDSEFNAVPLNTEFYSNTEENITLSFVDTRGNNILLNEKVDDRLTVSFVKSDDTLKFMTFPGNTIFPASVEPVRKIEPHDDGHGDHLHMLPFVGVAYAQEERQATTRYDVPVQFPVEGTYKAFVEFVVEGELTPRTVAFDVTVVEPPFTIDKYGWSSAKERIILSFISILIMLPIVWWVRRYLKNVTV